MKTAGDAVRYGRGLEKLGIRARVIIIEIMRLMLTIICVSVILSCGRAIAEETPKERPDIKLVDGRVLKRCKIISKTPLDAVILHAEGVENVKWETLPSEYREKHGYSPDKAAAHAVKLDELDEKTREVTKAKRIISDAAAKAMQARLKISQITDDGILATGFALVGPPRKELVTSYSSKKKGWGLTPNETVTTSNSRFVERRDRVTFDEYIFVKVNVSGHVDGDFVDLIIFPNGTYSYQSVGAGIKTIEKYTTDFVSLLSPGERSLVSKLSDEQIWKAFKTGFPD